MMKVLGIDILSGSPDSKSPPRYSIALLENREFALREEISGRMLMRTIRRLQPDRVACDNLFELLPKDKIRRFFFLLPSKTKVIQVNGSPENMEPLHVVAKRNGISITSKAKSMEEAEACAMLAQKNVGYEVRAFENETKIVVSRARSLGKGGQSQDRYRRKVHSMVALNIKEIRDILEEKGIEYRLERVKSDFGYSRGEFLIQLPRGELKGIRNKKGPDVQVKVLPVEKKKLSFTPLASEEKSVIVGVDPGTTTAIAVLDLEGDLQEVLSSRDFSQSDALSFLSRYKDVAVVASDVNPAPRFVERLSISLNSVLFSPPQSMGVEEKRELVDQKFSRDSYDNPHERDALAAAIKAYNNYKKKLDQIDKKLEELNLSNIKEEVRRLVIGGVSIDKAVKRLTEFEEEEEEEERVEAVPDKYKGIIRTLKGEIKILRSEREELKKALKGREERIAKLERKLAEIKDEKFKEIKREKEIQTKERVIRNLRSKLKEERQRRREVEERLRRMQTLEPTPDLALVKIVPQFTREKVLKARKYIKERDVLYITDASGGGRSAAEEVLKMNPRAIIAEKGKISHLAREALRDMIIIPPEKLEIKVMDEFGIVGRAALEEEIRKGEEKVKVKEAIRKEKWLETFITEYREERKRELK
jgi:hypothetical protein